MDFQTFSTYVLQAACAAAPLVAPRRMVKKIVDLALDSVVPVREDGSAYTREELLEAFDVLLEGDLSAYLPPITPRANEEPLPVVDEAPAFSEGTSAVPEPNTRTTAEGANDEVPSQG